MKCPACWAEKVYARKVTGWQRILHACLLMVPMRCHHCFHTFSVSWFRTIGATLTPPPPPPLARPVGLSHAARHYAALNGCVVPDSRGSEDSQDVPRMKAA